MFAGACGGNDSSPAPTPTPQIPTVNGSYSGSSGSFDEPSCGACTYAASGGLFGRELGISMSARSATCYNFNLTIVMSR